MRNKEKDKEARRKRHERDPSYRVQLAARQREYIRKRKEEDPDFRLKTREYQRTSYAKLKLLDPGRNKRHSKKYRPKRYGTTQERLNALFEAQGCVCGICLNANPGKGDWHIDHDHNTGLVRGLLCQQCNVGLGHFKDSGALLRAAVDYLEKER